MRTWVAGIVAGIAMFMWGFVSHMLLPTGDMGLKVLPAEDAVIGALKQDVQGPGI